MFLQAWDLEFLLCGLPLEITHDKRNHEESVTVLSDETISKHGFCFRGFRAGSKLFHRTETELCPLNCILSQFPEKIRFS